MEKVKKLINEVNTLLNTQQQDKNEKIKSLLQEAKPIIEKTEEEIKDNALKFNVFSALGVTRKETIQSKFLAYLLNPQEQHCQKVLFLNQFLEKININPIISETVKVTPEYYTKDYGRMDIVIDCQQADWLIVIENKIGAREQEKQLERYANWLNEQKHKQKKLIFITPTGRESVTAIEDNYTQLSYLELAELFESVKDNVKVNTVRVILEQYITTLKQIGGIEMSENKELIDLLSKPENIKAVLEIEQQALFVKRNIIKNFSDHIKTQLDSKIKAGNLGNTWELHYTDWKPGFDIGIKAKKEKLCYGVVIISIFRDENSFLWVLCSDGAEEETQSLAAKMIKDDGYQEGWISSSESYDLLAQRTINRQLLSNNVDDIIKCQQDNQSVEHPLAKEIADEIWAVFEKYRPDIEALPSFKSTT